MRESCLLAPSGHGGEFTQPRAHLLADPCTCRQQPGSWSFNSIIRKIALATSTRARGETTLRFPPSSRTRTRSKPISVARARSLPSFIRSLLCRCRWGPRSNAAVVGTENGEQGHTMPYKCLPDEEKRVPCKLALEPILL